MPTNEAAWLRAKNSKLEVGPAEYVLPGADEILIRNRAVAINPVDWILPAFGHIMFSWIKLPAVLGSDVAGEVVAVGDAVTRLKVGDRVVGQALGTSKARTRPAEGAFQAFTILVEHMTSPIPDALSFESASVLPLGASTAACALFQKDFLALRHPSSDPTPTGKVVLIWGGSTSVGSNAIQLATAAGYEVFTTASPRNFDYVRGLGASQAFDYNSPTVARDIIAAMKGKVTAGAFAIGTGSAKLCFKIIHACEGEKFVATASSPIAMDDALKGGRVGPALLMKFAAAGASQAVDARLKGVRTKFVFGDSLAENEVGPAIWIDFLPGALAESRYAAAPAPQVVGHGLENIETGFAAQRNGVSARKIVVTL